MPIRTPLAPLALAIHLGLAGALAAIPGAPALAAASQQNYAIPAGPLGEALNLFAQQAGIAIVFEAHTLAALRSPGLHGRYGVAEGLASLLQDSGYSAVQGANGWRLVENGAGVALPATNISGQGLGATTEGTGSYTTGSSSSATRLPLSLRETPQSISVITRQRLTDENLSSIESVLDRTPGISVQNIGSSRYGIYSRGYAIENFQLDGILTATDIVSQNIPQSQADMVIYDRVEVLRGATGLLTGAGDPSGTINLVRKKPTQQFQGHARLGLGSWDRNRYELDIAGPLGLDGNLRGRFVGAHEQGGTHIDHYKTEKSVLYGVLEADLGQNTLLTLGTDYQNTAPRGTSQTGLPLFYDTGEQTRFSSSSNAAARWSRNEISAYNSFLSLEHRFANDWEMKLSGNHLYATRDYSGATASWGFLDKDSGEGIRLYGGIGSARQRQSGFDIQLQGPLEAWGQRHELVLGFNWSEFENHHRPLRGAGIEGRYINIYQWDNQTAGPVITGEKLMDYDGWQKQYGPYSALRLKLRDDLSLIVGARASDYRYQLSQIYSNPASAANNRLTRMRESGVVTPYAGVVYELDARHSLYASYTSIFKPQSVRDRNGAVLEPREGDNYEIGLKSELFDNRLHSAIALYQVRQDNLAEADSGYSVPGSSPVEAAYRAVSGARTEGLDIELSGEPHPGWQVSLSYNYSNTKDGDGKRIRTVFPRQMAKLWTTYRLPGAWHKLSLGGGVNWQERIYYSATTWQLPGITLKGEQEAYAVVNLMARYDISERLSASLNLNNLFDKQYLQGLDNTFHTGISAPTRNAFANLNYQF